MSDINRMITGNNKTFKYSYNEYFIPERMMPAIQRYVKNHVKPGAFLQAVIRNDLFDAIGFADEENLKNLPAYAAYFYNETPSDCWGSREKMEKWLQLRK